MHRIWLATGALAGAVAVALAAWLAHGAPARLDAARLGMAQSAATMLGWHALALLATGLWAERRPSARLPHLAGAAFALGLVLFCGGVFGAAAGARLGPVAPAGGSLLIGGWLILLLAALRR